MGFFYCRNSPCVSTTFSDPAELGSQQAIPIDLLSTPDQVSPADSPPTFKPKSAPGSTAINYAPISLPVSNTGIRLAPRNSLPTTAPGPQPVKILGLVIYFELQKLWRIYMSTKRSSNNKSRFTLKTCYLDLYSGKFHLNYYWFCQ